MLEPHRRSKLGHLHCMSLIAKTVEITTERHMEFGNVHTHVEVAPTFPPRSGVYSPRRILNPFCTEWPTFTLGMPADPFPMSSLNTTNVGRIERGLVVMGFVLDVTSGYYPIFNGGVQKGVRAFLLCRCWINHDEIERWRQVIKIEIQGRRQPGRIIFRPFKFKLYRSISDYITWDFNYKGKRKPNYPLNVKRVDES